MDRNVTVAAAVVAVGVLGIAVAAATLTTAVPADGSGVGGGGNGTDAGLFPERDPPEMGGFDVVLPPIVGQVTLGLFALGAVAAAVYAVLNWREALQLGVVVVVVMAAIGALIWLISQLLGGGGFGGESGLFGGRGSGGIIGDAGGQGSLSVPPVVLVIVGGALVAAAVSLFGATSSLSAEDEDDEESGTAPSAAAAGVGRAAGRAAERIEADADVDNEVYEAWKEMTTHLRVDRPESSTPGEFAAAAVDAGMAREDVEELTRLFEEVRYGGADPAGREQRAVATLRRIEESYGE